MGGFAPGIVFNSAGALEDACGEDENDDAGEILYTVEAGVIKYDAS